jgi:hypothetical protein
VTTSVRQLLLTSLAGLVLVTGSVPPVAVAQSPAGPVAPTDALGIAGDLVGLLGYALRHVADRPWVSPDDPAAVPLNLVPPLSIATTVKARAYSDGCHAMPRVRKATGCDYGVVDSPVTVVILGDSHGAMWLPAMERIAADKGWRIHLLTKSACTPASLTVLRKGKPYKQCDAWRKSAFKVIDKLKPDMVMVASTSEYDLKSMPYSLSQGYFDTWRAGMADTLRTVGRSAGQVVLLNDVPKHTQDPVACLLQHPDDATACATPRDVAMRPQMVEAYRGAAQDAGATFVDPTPLVCPGDPCPVVDGRNLVVYDDSHLTPAYSQRISAGFEALLPQIPTP